MTHGVLILIGCIVIILTRKLYYSNFEFFLCLLIPINFDFFHLAPSIGGFHLYKESLIVVILFYLFEEYIVRPQVLSGRKSLLSISSGIYSKLYVAYLFLLIGGFLVACYHGQSMALGIMAMKFYPLLLTYFLILKRGLNVTKFISYFIWLAFTTAILTFLIYFSYGTLSIFDTVKVLGNDQATRGIRIAEGSIIITVGTIITFSRWLKTRQIHFLFLTVFLLSNLLLVLKTRAILVSIIIVILFYTFLFTKNKSGTMAKSFYLISSGVVLILLYTAFNPEAVSENAFINKTLTDVQGVSSSNNGEGSLQVRLITYQFYWQIFKTYWLAGRGLLNLAWVGNPDVYIKTFYHFWLSDIGAFHMIVNFGICGGMFIAYMIFITLKRIRQLINTTPEVASYFLLGLILLPQIDIFFNVGSIFIFAIFTACADYSVANTVKIEAKS